MEEEEGDNSGGIPAWIVSYADLMTLLFATFVVLYGLKPEGETQAFEGAISTIRESFREVPDDIPMKMERGDIILGKSRFPKDKGNAASPPILSQKEDTEYPIRQINSDFQKAISLLSSRSKKILEKQSEEKNMETFSFSASDNELKLSLLGSAFFKKNSSKLNRQALQEIEPVLQMISTLNKPIHLMGHAALTHDSINLSPWILSAERAYSLANHIISKYSYPREKITAAGFGSEKPINSKTENSHHTGNDRVEILVNFDIE